MFTLGLINLGVAQEKHKNIHVYGNKTENLSPSGHIRCATNEHEEYLRSLDPKRMTVEQFENWLTPLIEKQKQAEANKSESGGIIYIPVVVHVIHDGDAYGTNENISDEQVQSQITVMNQDFRRMLGTPGYNTNPIGADTQIEFVLAKVDPNGNPTNGINRVNLCRANYNAGSSSATSALVNSQVKPQTQWDPTLYMNMWSVNWDGSGLLGYAQFPESSLGGLSTAAQSANTDGVVSAYSTFGSRTIYPAGTYSGTQYDKGRTMTHEVGHYLGLRHIWGDDACPAGGGNVATNEDFVADTPAASAANYGCPAGTNSCPAIAGNDMIENYMDYTDDSCMNIFTSGQKTRITTVMNNSPRRLSLKTSTKDIAISLFANDAEVKIENSCSTPTPTCATPKPAAPLKDVLLYNRGTANLTAATLSYNMNGGTTYTQNWTGNLATNKYAKITLPNTAVNGTLNVTITAANGTDQRASNNTASKTFGVFGVPYANTTTFTFNLVGDRWGSEISWTLKNASGATLQSGGPYTDAATEGTQTLVNNQTWTLPANGCYYLTVTDSYGDGLYDGVAQGYYTVTGAATTVVNVPNFVVPGGTTAVSRVNYFTNSATLSTEDFQLINGITLYPNPSKDFFTISLPESLESKGSFEIFNNVGQKIYAKNINNNSDLQVNTSSLSSGIYFITLKIGNANRTFKFIKE